MDKVLTLVTTDHQKRNFEILTVAWVNNPHGSYIEIAAKDATLQVNVKIKSGISDPEPASRLHDKLLSVYGKTNTQITAYVEAATVTTSIEVRLDKCIVYLIV